MPKNSYLTIGAKSKFERCNVCAQYIHRNCFAAQLRGNSHLLKTGDKVRCEICRLVHNLVLIIFSICFLKIIMLEPFQLLQ